jgi:hypothetical protein
MKWALGLLLVAACSSDSTDLDPTGDYELTEKIVRTTPCGQNITIDFALSIAFNGAAYEITSSSPDLGSNTVICGPSSCTISLNGAHTFQVDSEGVLSGMERSTEFHSGGVMCVTDTTWSGNRVDR